MATEIRSVRLNVRMVGQLEYLQVYRSSLAHLVAKALERQRAHTNKDKKLPHNTCTVFIRVIEKQ